MNASRAYIGTGLQFGIEKFAIQKYLKRYFDLFALEDDQETERQQLEDRQREERETERDRLQDEADKAHDEKEDAEKRESDAQSEAKKL